MMRVRVRAPLRAAGMVGLTLGLGSLSACGGMTHDHVVTGRLGAAYGGPVQVVMDSSPEPAIAEEIGMVRAIGWGNQANLGSVVEGLRAEAAMVGADGVIRVRIDQGQNTVSAVGVAVVLAR